VERAAARLDPVSRGRSLDRRRGGALLREIYATPKTVVEKAAIAGRDSRAESTVARKLDENSS